jgi:hypothetical protein
MVKIIERVQAHYESREMPFGKTYEWHPACIVLECGCGKRWTIDAKSAITTCQCGRDLANGLTRGIQEGEATLPEEFTARVCGVVLREAPASSTLSDSWIW